MDLHIGVEAWPADGQGRERRRIQKSVRWLIRVRKAKGRARERFRVGRVAGSEGSREENLDLAS